MSNEKSSNKYFIKDKLIFSSNYDTYTIPSQIYKISFPSETKNILTNNKMIMTELKKVSHMQGKDIKLSKPIQNYENLKNEIEEIKKSKSENIYKPKDDDYEFIEKTSQIEIIKGILENINDNEIIELKEGVLGYINSIKSKENEKKAEIEEDLEIENKKIEKIENEKNNFINENISPENKKIKENEEKILTLEDKNEKLIKKLEESLKTKKEINIDKINKKIEEIEHKINDLNLEVKIIQSKAQTVKDDIKLGEKKCINWISFILTLGLIYWTKYSDCKYKLLKINNKYHKKKEKILIYERKKFNLEKILKDTKQKETKNSLENSKKRDEMIKEIEDTKIKIKEIKENNKQLKEIIKKKENEIKDFDIEIKKIENKLIEIETINEELDKYSTKEIKKELEEIINSREEEIEEIKKIKEKISNQKIKIDGEWIVEL